MFNKWAAPILMCFTFATKSVQDNCLPIYAAVLYRTLVLAGGAYITLSYIVTISFLVPSVIFSLWMQLTYLHFYILYD